MQKVCPHCGEPMPEEAVFCLHCFSSVDGTKETVPPLSAASAEHKNPVVQRIQHSVAERCTAGVLLFTLLTSMLFSFASRNFSPVSALNAFTRRDGLFTEMPGSDKTETAEAKADGDAAGETASIFPTVEQSTRGILGVSQNPLNSFLPTTPLVSVPSGNPDNGGKTP